MNHIKLHIANVVSQLTQIEKDFIEGLLEKPKNQDHGDVALPCFQLAKKTGTPPAQFAEQLKNKITSDNYIQEVTQLGPFLNFKINMSTQSKCILFDALHEKAKEKNGVTYIVEYSSPNIAKPFHVGHLRATLIGNCLDRLYSYRGFLVESINHLGDWGTQFGYVYAGCTLWGAPEEFSVQSLVALYKKATALKDEEEKNNTAHLPSSVTTIARDYFLRLESGEPDALSFWKKCVDVSLIYLKNTYARLNVSFAHYLGESFYSDKMDAISEDLLSKNLLTESQGARGVDLGEPLGFARILTPDGRSLYLTRDLAAAEYRFQRFNFKKSIYVVGAPQSLHFNQLKAILEKAEKSYADDIVHVAFGHVLGMKTRGDGQTIELNDFIDEANSRALHAYRTQVEKRPSDVDEYEVSQRVALAAVIFSTLNRNNIKDVHFNWDDALSFQGDSGPYLLYAYARLCGIEEKANKEGIHITDHINFQHIDTQSAHTLLLTLLAFDPTTVDACTHNEPLYLCAYALELSKAISKAYVDLKVIGASKEEAQTRLSLFMAAKHILETTLKLIGIEPIKKM